MDLCRMSKVASLRGVDWQEVELMGKRLLSCTDNQCETSKSS